MKITVIGGGNVGTQFACICAAKGHPVTVYSSRPEAYSETLTIVNSENTILCEGKPHLVTADIKAAMDAELVFVTYPANLFEDLAAKMEPFVKAGQYIGIIPGSGGAEFAFRKCIKSGAVLFGLQRVPSVARLVEYGKTVCAEGKRDRLHLASVPAAYSEKLAAFMAETFDMPCEVLPNYLCVTMTPSNPILHTARLSTMFIDYKDGVVYDRNPLFYEEWSDASSERLLGCNAEHQAMLRRLNGLDLSSVKSLVEHYDNSDTPEKMTAKLRSIKSFRGITSPMKQVEGGWIPDFSSRYFSADFPFGLAIIESLADLLGADIPYIRQTMDWYRSVTKRPCAFDLGACGIHTPEDICDLYR